MTCNHSDNGKCRNCAIPAIAWWRKPGVCGGEAVFIGTRIEVAHVVALLRRGWADWEIAREYPSLTVGQVRKAAERLLMKS